MCDSDIERLLSVFRLEEPDRVPFWEPIIEDRVVRAVMGKSAESAQDWVKFASKVGMDAIGCGVVWNPGRVTRKTSDGRSFVVNGSIKDWDAAEDAYGQLPDPQPYINKVQSYIEAVKGTKLGSWFYVHGPFDAAYLAMGLVTFFRTLRTDPSLVTYIMDQSTAFYASVAEVLAQTDVSFMNVADDIGTKTGLMINSHLFRRLWIPRVKKLIAPIKNKKLLTFHSDGNPTEIIPDLIRFGFSAIHPLEPYGLDIYRVAEHHSQKIALMGNLDVALLSSGSPNDVTNAAKTLIQRLASAGGYVLCSSHSITNNVPPENYLAMIKAAKTYGKYPIKRL